MSYHPKPMGTRFLCGQKQAHLLPNSEGVCVSLKDAACAMLIGALHLHRRGSGWNQGMYRETAENFVSLPPCFHPHCISPIVSEEVVFLQRLLYASHVSSLLVLGVPGSFTAVGFWRAQPAWARVNLERASLSCLCHHSRVPHWQAFSSHRCSSAAACFYADSLSQGPGSKGRA